MYGRPLSAIIAFAFVVAACGTQPPSDPSVPSSSDTAPTGPPRESEPSSPTVMPSYDPDAPLEVEERPHATMSGADLIDLSYASPGGGRVSAWMVVPEGDGPFAGLVYLHGSETDRDDFVDEALAMASGGAVSILIDAPFRRSGADRTGTLQDYFAPESEAALVEQTVGDIRRAYDLLAERTDVDAARLGFVGHSWGASIGPLLAAADDRAAALVMIAGRPSWTGFLIEAADRFAGSRALVGDAGWEHYLEVMAPYDAVTSLSGLTADRLYLQFGAVDDVVTPAHAAEWVAAAPAGVTVDTYPGAGHALDATAVADRARWLADRLGLEMIRPDALAEVGLPDRPSRIP